MPYVKSHVHNLLLKQALGSCCFVGRHGFFVPPDFTALSEMIETAMGVHSWAANAISLTQEMTWPKTIPIKVADTGW